MSRFIFPGFALAVSIYLVVEQILGSYRPTGSYYIFGLAAPVILLALLQVREDLMASRKRQGDGDEPAAATGGQAEPGSGNRMRPNDRRVAIFIGAAVLSLILLSYLGYLLSFGLFLIATFWLLGFRKPLHVILLTAGTLLFIQLLFIEWLGTRLPEGILAPWL